MHVPKTAGKSVLNLFGLPVLGKDYHGDKNWIEHPYGHVSIQEYRDKDWYSDYFKFAIVRNPLDRLVSAFHFLNSGGLNEGDRAFAEKHLWRYDGDFQKFVVEGLKDVLEYPHFRPQTHWVCAGKGQPLVDLVGRYETLDDSMKEIATHIGLQYSGLPHLNRSERRSWTDHYDLRSRAVAMRVYAWDFWRFGYSWRK